MSNLLKAERYKLLRDPIFLICTAVMFILGFVMADGYREAANGLDSMIPVSSISGMFNSAVSDISLLTLFIPGLLALGLGNEFSQRVLSSEVASGHGRRDIFLSKAIVNFIGYNLVCLVYPVAGVIKEFGYFGAGDIADNCLNILRTTVYMFLLTGALFFIAMAASFVIKNGIAAAIVTTVLNFGLMMTFVYAKAYTWVTYIHPMYNLRIITMTGGSTFKGAGIFDIPSIVTCLVWIGSCSIIIWTSFKKADLK